MTCLRVLCGVAVFCAACSTVRAQDKAEDTYSTAEQIQNHLSFATAGYGKQFFKVDKADVVFSVSAQHLDFKQAKKLHDEAVARVRQYILEGNHKDDHFELKSTRLFREPNHTSQRRDDHYTCVSTYFVRTSKLADLADFQAALVERGADEIHSATLFSSRQREFEDDARKLAIDDAKKKAALAVEQLGWRLGKILRADFGETRYSSAHGEGAGFGSRGGDRGGASAENIAGADYVEASITLVYEYTIK